MARLIDVLRLIRVINCVMTSASVWAGGYLSPNYIFGEDLLLTMAGAFCLCGAGNVLNDILDIKIDTISHPNRALVKNTITRRSAWVIYIILTMAGLITSVFVNVHVSMIAFSVTILLILYNFLLKRIVLAGNVLIAFLGGMTVITGGLAINPSGSLFVPGPIIPAIFGFILHLAREMVKDIQDARGDKTAGIMTLPQKIGDRNTFVIVGLWTLILAVMIYIPYQQDWFSVVYFVMAMAGVIAPILLLTLFNILDSTPRKLGLCAWGIKGGMVIGLIAIVVGKNF